MRTSSQLSWTLTLLVVVSLAADPARADESVAEDSGRDLFSVDVYPLVSALNESHIVSDPPTLEASYYQMDTTPHLAMPAGVEAYLLKPEDPNDEYRGYRVIGEKPRGEPVSGKLFMIRRSPHDPLSRVLAGFEIRVAAEPSSPATREDFLRAKGQHFQRLWSEEMAGAAMFRHLAMTSLGQIGETAKSSGPQWRPSRSGIDSTIQLMSGGRAVSENLQLDAELNGTNLNQSELKPLGSVRGVTIREIDWSRILSNKPTELDPLATFVPHDQYAIFLPSFEALTDIVDRGGELARPAAQWFEPQSRKTDVLGFYQQQLALPLNGLTRRIGKALIGEIAVTGSDPYFRTGTDVAVLMQSDQVDLLHQSVLAQVAATASTYNGAKRIEHKVDDHLFTHWSTDDRRLSSFIARLDGGVVVSNSLHQMMEILKCSDGRGKSMGELDEYRFFRQRYPRTSVNETALVVITDAAIRRWCGPQWRITAARRTRARATIAEVTMQHADELVHGTLETPLQIPSPADAPDAGVMSVSNRGVVSDKYGTLDFQTPIAELDLRYATKGEVAVYERWRSSYERRWRRNFDPIAIQLSVTDHRMKADVSVIPLILQSEYRTYTQWVGDAQIPEGTSDPHPESVAGFSMALDMNSGLMPLIRGLISGGTNVDLFAWINDSIHVYFDRDEEWFKRINEQSPWDAEPAMWVSGSPIAVFIPSKDNLIMTAFVVAVRARLEQAAPNMIRWENAKYKDFQYVVGTFVRGSWLGPPDGLPEIYYVTTSEGFTLSPSRRVIERTIERHMVGGDAAEQATAAADPTGDRASDQLDSDMPFPPQVAMRTTGQGLLVMAGAKHRSSLSHMNRIAWSNLPILNYFRFKYPDKDPKAVYENLFGETLVEPTGGDYQWNDQRGTYVSTLHGYHLEPKAGPVIADVFHPNDEISAALSFQGEGLRALVEVRQHHED